MLSRRELFTAGGIAAALKVAEAVSPSIARAHEDLSANWPEHFAVFQEGGKPHESDQLEPRPLVAETGQVVVVDTGDVAMDGNFEYLAGEKGHSITIVEGPVGAGKGAEVWVKYRKRYSSVQVFTLPFGKLGTRETGRLINRGLKSSRDNHGDKGETFVPIIDGKSGKVRERRYIPQGQWAVED